MWTGNNGGQGSGKITSKIKKTLLSPNLSTVDYILVQQLMCFCCRTQFRISLPIMISTDLILLINPKPPFLKPYISPKGFPKGSHGLKMLIPFHILGLQTEQLYILAN